MVEVFGLLQDKLAFIRRFYNSAAKTFESDLRNIEMHVEPYDTFDPEDGEPPFLSQWLDDKESLNLSGKACLCLVAAQVNRLCYDEPVMVTNVVATITALEAQAAASLFLSDNLGDRFLASSPKLDVAANVWRVPILLAYPIIGPVGQTGEILVNETSEEIISYTPLEEMKATARRLYEENRDAIEAAFLRARNP